jgi:exonuclease VII large subunit
LQEEKRIECDYCPKTYTQAASLQRHLKTCSGKPLHEEKQKVRQLKEELRSVKKEGREIKKMMQKMEKRNKDSETKLTKNLEESKDKISELEGIITGLKTAPDKRTIYNTNTAYVHPKLVNLPINNIRALTQEYMIEKVSDGILTYEKAARGYPGILEVIGELITHENDEGEIERNYVCTDVSRNSFHRLLESKKWKSDKGGRYLNNMLDTFRDVMEEYKDKAYNTYDKTPHDSIEWGQVDWERKNISLLYSGIVSREGKSDREELVNILRKEISKRASV